MGVCFKCRGGVKKSSVKPLTYAYSGNYTESIVTVDGTEYTQLALTGSGTLTVSREINADVWMCGGGGNGGYSNNKFYSNGLHAGGGGAGAYAKSGAITLSGDMVASVASAAGVSSFGGISASAGGSGTPSNYWTDSTNASDYAGGSGGTGGGCGVRCYSETNIFTGTYGTGDGVSKYPFSDSVNMKCHCAGGGGGGLLASKCYTHGCSGGTNGGSSGYLYNYSHTNTQKSVTGGTGGSYGGGKGGGCSNYYDYTDGYYIGSNGSNATFYGAGGGGGGKGNIENYFSGGSGYQGVIYIRWKTKDAA